MSSERRMGQAIGMGLPRRSTDRKGSEGVGPMPRIRSYMRFSVASSPAGSKKLVGQDSSSGKEPLSESSLLVQNFWRG